MITRKIPNFPNYRARNDGSIINIKTNKVLKPSIPFKTRPYYQLIKLFDKRKTKVFVLDKLILKLFKPWELTGDKTHALHVDNNLQNNESKNLIGGTLSDRLRQAHRLRGKRRGVYPYMQKFRAVIRLNGKIKTIGYRKTKEEAEKLYIQTYTRIFGVEPYANI